jgi:alkanesulfonate monooxygenase SsuD/methylene tetrahydromethanopterin reductase-like flavin-dependent oxidoreductase (luciferase family)
MGRGRINPRPYQDRIPIWMGYQGPRGATRAGLLGEGLMSLDPALVEPYRTGLREAGHDPSSARMAGNLPVFVTEDPAADWPTVARHVAYQLDSYRHHAVEGTSLVRPDPIDPERLRRGGITKGNSGIICADPETVAGEIRSRLAGVPVETLFIWASIAGMDEDLTIRHIQTVTTRLAPLLA